MTLKELGYEYLRQYEEIKAYIKAIKKTEKDLTRKQQLRLRRRLLSLYADAASLRVTGEHLVNYYGGANE